MCSLIPRNQVAGIGHSVVTNFAVTYGMIALFALFIAYKLSESIADGGGLLFAVTALISLVGLFELLHRQ